jgi:Predicted pyridoxal phosphate-dependent enzyme apparently involved in regulation of cell wall biogenesis
MITTDDAALAARLRKLRQHAMTVSDVARHSSQKVVIESYDEIGFNYRMTDLQAAVGIVQLQRLDEMLSRRRMLAERYSAALSRLGWLTVPHEPAGYQHNFQSYMVRLKDGSPMGRDELMQELLDRGIASRRGVMPIHREAPYRSERWDSRLPVSNLVADTSVILPLFHDMTEDEQDYVIDCIRRVGTLTYKASH